MTLLLIAACTDPAPVGPDVPDDIEPSPLAGADPRYAPPFGEGTAAAWHVSASRLAFDTSDGAPVSEDLAISSIGDRGFRLDTPTVDDAAFVIEGEFPTVLRPGESATLRLTYTPVDEGERRAATLRFTASDTPVEVALAGEDHVGCIGVGEAWDRGLVTARTNDLSAFELTVTEAEVCVDDWLVWTSPGGQDLAAGHKNDARVTVSDVIVWAYLGSTRAWGCLEHAQVVAPEEPYVYTGATLPEPLLTLLHDDDQAGTWDWLDANPVMIAARDTHYAVVPLDGGSANVVLRPFNMGGVAGTARVLETVPAGYTAGDFDPLPSAEEVGLDGEVTYAWDIALDARTPSAEGTIYDEAVISYTLSVPACVGRVELPGTRAQWTDSAGVAREDGAVGMIVRCGV